MFLKKEKKRNIAMRENPLHDSLLFLFLCRLLKASSLRKNNSRIWELAEHSVIHQYSEDRDWRITSSRPAWANSKTLSKRKKNLGAKT
jgi:hypothetical protein